MPEAGPVQVAGLTLERARGVITDALKHQYRDVQVAVTVGCLRIRVYVVGDVQRPGAFDISSLSTFLAALIAAGGPTNIGSLRVLQHYRGQHLVEEGRLIRFFAARGAKRRSVAIGRHPGRAAFRTSGRGVWRSEAPSDL